MEFYKEVLSNIEKFLLQHKQNLHSLGINDWKILTKENSKSGEYRYEIRITFYDTNGVNNFDEFFLYKNDSPLFNMKELEKHLNEVITELKI